MLPTSHRRHTNEPEPTHLAKVDSLEIGPEGIQIRFDAARVDDLRPLFERVERGPEGIRTALREIRTEFLTMRLPEIGISLPGLDGRSFELERWYDLTVEPTSSAAEALRVEVHRLELQGGDPSAEEPRTNFLTNARIRDARTQPLRNLVRAFSLRDVEPATKEELWEVLGRPADSDDDTRNFHVNVYDVGQGACVGLSHGYSSPVVAYFDFGGGALAHARTYPQALKFCFTERPPVILSHWDLDHWVSGERHPTAKGLQWIVPRQSLGITHAKFAAELHLLGNLLLWPDSVPSLDTGIGTILKLPKHSNRNYSGLVLLVPNGCGGHVLCPGDAPYGRISISGKTITGLVASHHGGLYRERGQPPRAPSDGGTVVYSYGRGNTYRHPRPCSMKQHYMSGWHNAKCTPGGHCGFPPRGTAPYGPPCVCLICRGSLSVCAINAKA